MPTTLFHRSKGWRSARLVPGSSAFVLCWVALAGGAHGQVEWFTKERATESGFPWTSHLLTMAEAHGQMYRKSCTSAMANVPEPKPAYWKQFDACGTPVTLERGQPARFEGADQVPVTSTLSNPTRTATLQSIAWQEAVFGRDSLSVDARVGTKTTNAHLRLNRGLPRVHGEVYFRVPKGLAQPFTFEATMTWNGQVIWNRVCFITRPRAK